jgi:hypothetical protein
MSAVYFFKMSMKLLQNSYDVRSRKLKINFRMSAVLFLECRKLRVGKGKLFVQLWFVLLCRVAAQCA